MCALCGFLRRRAPPASLGWLLLALLTLSYQSRSLLSSPFRLEAFSDRTRKSSGVDLYLRKNMSTAGAKHPFYPRNLKLPHYVENARSGGEILALFGAVVAVIGILAWIITAQRTQKFCLLRRLVLCWFLICAFIHIVLEGYYAVFHATLAGHTTFLGELWKEYSKGDSRYLTSDTAVFCIESFTAVIDGPLAFLTFFAFMRGSNHRYGLQMVLSLCQLYGDVLYYMTALKEGFRSSPTDSILYFYFYVLFINAFWIVIPLLLIIDSLQHIAACQTVSDFYIDEYNRKHGINNHKKSK